MASYNNPQPFVPTVPEFQPDLNSYQQLLSMKEAQYQAGYQKISGLYGSLYNSPMIREDNKEARSKYFDKIESDIKKLAGYDLSLEQNITSAQKIFKPLSDDPFIMKDIAFTKQVQAELGKAESLRNSVPKEGEPKFWEGGIRALTYQVDDFAAAPREKSLNMQAPRYTPFVNVAEKAMKWAKDMGLSMTTTSKQGGFIITTKNGQPMEADLRDTFLSVFGNDAAVQEMYRTQAYLTRKDAIASTLDQYPSAELAEAAYLDMSLAAMDMDAKEVLAQTQPKLESIAAKKALAEKAMQSYTYDPELDKDIADLAAQLHMDEQAVTSTKANAEAILQHVNVSGMGQLDLDAKRMRVDGASANYLMLNDLSHAAKAYSQLTMEQESEVDPFALAAVNHANQMSQINAKADLDLMTEYAKMGVNINEENALDKYWERKLLLDQTGTSTGTGKGTGPVYPGTPSQNPYGSNSNGSENDPNVTVTTDAPSQVIENIDVYAENYKKVKESESSVVGYANALTTKWMGTLASIYHNETGDKKLLALQEMKKVIGIEKFETLKKSLGKGDAEVINQIEEWNREGKEMYDDSPEGTLMAVYSRAKASTLETLKTFNQAVSSSQSTGKILRVSAPVQNELIALQQETDRNLFYWKQFDQFAKDQNKNVISKMGPVTANDMPVIQRYKNAFLDEKGKPVSRDQFVSKFVNPEKNALDRLLREQDKDFYVLDAQLHHKALNLNTGNNREEVLAGINEYRNREKQRLMIYKNEALKENMLLEDPYDPKIHFSTPEAFASAMDKHIQSPPINQEKIRFSPLKSIVLGERKYGNQRVVDDEVYAINMYNQIKKTFYDTYNGNVQSADNTGAAAKQWNSTALLGKGSGGLHTGIKTIGVDQAQFDPHSNPHFGDIYEVMTKSPSLEGNYQFGSIRDITGGNVENDDKAKLAWEKISSLLTDPGLADDSKKNRVRGKFEVSAIAANNPNLVGFTWRPDPAFLEANKGTKTTEGLFSKEDLTKLMGGVSFTIDKQKASSLKIISDLAINNDEAALGVSSERHPIVLSHPDAGSITVYAGPKGYVINQNLNFVDEGGNIRPWVEPQIIESFESYNILGRANALIEQRAQAIRAYRLSLKNQK